MVLFVVCFVPFAVYMRCACGGDALSIIRVSQGGKLMRASADEPRARPLSRRKYIFLFIVYENANEITY